MYSENGLLSTVAYKIGENSPAIYALEGIIKEAGSIVSWLSSLGIFNNGDDKQILPVDIDYESDVTLMPSSSGSLAPHWR